MTLLLYMCFKVPTPLNGEIEARGKSHVSGRMDTRHVDSTTEAIGDLSGHIFAVGCRGKRRVRCYEK